MTPTPRGCLWEDVNGVVYVACALLCLVSFAQNYPRESHPRGCLYWWSIPVIAAWCDVTGIFHSWPVLVVLGFWFL